MKTVPVPMYAKGTIVTICGAPADNNAGTPGDNTVDGFLAAEAFLGNPASVKAGADGSIYVSSSMFGKVKRIDGYGYISIYAGNGSHGSITPGTAASSSPIGAVSDIDIDPAGNLYLFNYWNQIIRVENGVISSVAYDNGTANPVARFDLAVTNVDLLYFVNYLDPRAYRVISSYTTTRERFEARVLLASSLPAKLGTHMVDVVVVNDVPPLLGRRIVTEGRRVFCADEAADHAFVRDVQLRAADLEPFLRRTRRVKLAALAR